MELFFSFLSFSRLVIAGCKYGIMGGGGVEMDKGGKRLGLGWEV